MKKLIILIAFVSVAFTVKAAPEELNYVSVKGKPYFSQDLKIGYSNARIRLEDGTMLKASLKDVDAYMINGKLFERMPLICIDGKYKGTALLEFIAQRGDLRLYKYCTRCENEEFGCRFFDKGKREALYLVYKAGKPYLYTMKQNVETVLPFFGVEVKFASLE